MGMFAHWDGATPTLTYTGATGATVNTSGTHSAAGLSFGTVDSTRLIICVLGYSNGTGGSVGSVTIGGIAATKVVGTSNTGRFSEIWIAAVPTGTTGTIARSGPTGNWTSDVGVYAAYNLLSATATATDVSAATPIVTSVAVSDYGVAVTTAFANGSPTGSSMTGATQDFVDIVSSAAILVGGSFTTTAATTLNVTTTLNGGLTRAGCTASFR
jgi:hypothetical protein